MSQTQDSLQPSEQVERRTRSSSPRLSRHLQALVDTAKNRFRDSKRLVPSFSRADRAPPVHDAGLIFEDTTDGPIAQRPQRGNFEHGIVTLHGIWVGVLGRQLRTGGPEHPDLPLSPDFIRIFDWRE
jgi:hypothetical protein